MLDYYESRLYESRREESPRGNQENEARIANANTPMNNTVSPEMDVTNELDADGMTF